MTGGERAPMRSNGMPTVLYITGSGRSGSTLLERILGAVPGFVNVGELIELFRRVAVQDERCGCGLDFSACPFWQQVGKRAFGRWDPSLLTRVTHQQVAVARQRHLPRLLAPALASSGFRDALEEYASTYASLYRAIATEADAEVIVDASKWPAQALALARTGQIDFRVLHLVRDARGVAYSWQKTGIARPHSVHGSEMATHRASRTAVRWTTFQLEAAALARTVPHGATVRYEDLVANPRRTLRAALDDLGFDAASDRLDHVTEHGLVLGPSHGLAGNPSRFQHGEVRLRVDDEWRTQMANRPRRVVTAIAWPQLLGYGYGPGRRRLQASPGRVRT
jgi:hypothetical protein